MPDLRADKTAALLAVEGLECRRGERMLFSGLDFRLEPGAIVWVRGANGQGKTTLLRTLAGLSRPEAGRLAWREPEAVGRVLYLAHANALKEELSVIESLRFLRELDGPTTTAADLEAALDRFGMASRRAAAGAHPVAGSAPPGRAGPPRRCPARHRFGCSTSPSTPSMPAASTSSTPCSLSTPEAGAASCSPATCR